MNYRKFSCLLLALVWGVQASFSQLTFDPDTVKPGRFDRGKMWTFEHPPKEYWKQAYNLDATDEWLADVRKSALRFASWCSASFVSANGLIMTNHHCARSVVTKAMLPGEDFDTNGFYAPTQEEERKIPALYVDQMVMLADITAEVNAKLSGTLASERKQRTEAALEDLKKEYAAKPGWTGLEIETRTFYSGGQFSIYGFKRYNDIRLVLYPETGVAYFGGDADNFTYPRYNLDFTFFRAYDETGLPLRPANYFKFNASGPKENEPVFVIGNPGRTGRYKTIAQLQFDRDVHLPLNIDYLDHRVRVLNTYVRTVVDTLKKDSVINLAFGLANAHKAYTGQLKGMRDPYLMAKKVNWENELKKNVQFTEGTDAWDKILRNTREMEQVYAEQFLLSPSPQKGKVLAMLHLLYDYYEATTAGNTQKQNEIVASMTKLQQNFEISLERALLFTLLQELNDHSKNNYLVYLFEGRNINDLTFKMVDGTRLLKEETYKRVINQKPEKLRTDTDPLVRAAFILIPQYKSAVTKMTELNNLNNEQIERIAAYQYQVSGDQAPPDATFSLRIADGVVRKYNYNGTQAPYKTHYYGLYDRYYSYDQKIPWVLPDRWQSPTPELLKSPLNFIATNDIIGGNSGSAIVNRNKEVVGLAFDGNIESLPGYFIYNDTSNRCVGVHSGGIAAALQHVYKAYRIVLELGVKI